MYTSLTHQQQSFLYGLYLSLRDSPLTDHGRYRTFETAAVDFQPWHIEGISVNALEQLVTNRSAKGLRRGHRMARKDRAAHMFHEDVEMNQHQMLSYFYENDVVTVITSDENAEDGDAHWSDVIKVPPERLKGGSYSMYATKADIAWAAEELAKYLKSKVNE